MTRRYPTRSEAIKKPRRDASRPFIGIRELKAKASAVIEEVKGRRITYAVTKRGAVEALIVPVDAGERLVQGNEEDRAWDAWQTLVDQLAGESTKTLGSAAAELRQMRR